MTQIVRLKRTTTPNHTPGSLALAELALGLGDRPRKVWVGTQQGVQEILRSGSPHVRLVEDAADDGVYGRSNGDWTPLPAVGATAPQNPVSNMLWCDTATMRLYVYFEGQWAEIQGL